MKITPFIVILLLLIVLILFTFCCKLPFFQREGFITFLKNEDSMTEQIIPQYSDDTVYKLYDNLYFDRKNGSLIEVDGASEDTNADGNIVDSIIVTPRIEQDSYVYDITSDNDKIELPNNIFHSSLRSKLYYTQSNNTNKYAVIYVKLVDKKTFIHVLNISSSPFKQDNVFLFSEDGSPQGKILEGETLENMDCIEDMESDNNKDVLES